MWLLNYNQFLCASLQWATRTSPKIAFADASSTDEAIQQTVSFSHSSLCHHEALICNNHTTTNLDVQIFVQTGGDLADCCLDGCSCNFGVSTPASSVLPYSVRPGGPPFGKRGGQRDWTRTLKVSADNSKIIFRNHGCRCPER